MPSGRTEPMLSTYLHSRGGELGLPIGGNFELTARCNFNCPMCYVHRKDNDAEAMKGELSAQQWIDIAQQARDAGMVFALLTGGEPFIRSDFFEIYGAMKAMGLLVSINSNGSMLKGKTLERLLADPPFRINVTLYGSCAQTYREMCGQDAFTDVVENLRALKNAGVDVRLNLSITPYNRQDLEGIFHLSREIGLHVKTSGYMYPPARLDGDCGHRLTPEEAAQVEVQWEKLRLSPEDFALRAQRMKELTGLPREECPVELEEGVGCRAGRSSFWLTWDGRMLPCGMMTSPVTYPLETGFTEAWQQLLKATDLIRLPAQCAACSKRKVCSVCAAVCQAETGAFDGVPKYVCQMTDANILWTEKENDQCN